MPTCLQVFKGLFILASGFSYWIAIVTFPGLSDEEDQKPVRLPLKVPVELQPRSNQAWARVQSLAQNPRLRYENGSKILMAVTATVYYSKRNYNVSG